LNECLNFLNTAVVLNDTVAENQRNSLPELGNVGIGLAEKLDVHIIQAGTALPRSLAFQSVSVFQ
jgi:hypothetical protein